MHPKKVAQHVQRNATGCCACITVMSYTVCLHMHLRWFVDLFSESFMPGLFGMLRADSDESLEAAQTKFDTALKVRLFPSHHT